MKNTKQFYFQNGLSVVLQGLSAMLGEGEEYKPSPDMYRREDRLYYYNGTYSYMIYRNSQNEIVLVYYTDLKWEYHSYYDRLLYYNNQKQFKFNTVAECINCLVNGDHRNAQESSVACSFNYWYNGPKMYRIYHPTFGPQERQEADPNAPFYVFYSTHAYSYENGSYHHAYVDKKLI